MIDTVESVKKKIYLAGPMRHYQEFNFPAFFEAEKILRQIGFEVFNPAARDIKQDNFNPKTDKAKSLRHYMCYDLPEILECDAVAVLTGWEHSKGARLEVHVARECDIPVFEISAVFSDQVQI